MAGSDRAISVLQLFTFERPDWTVEQIRDALEVSVSSVYRYVAILEEAGLVTTVANGRYTLGPAIIQFDRQIQLTDPLLRHARPVMADIVNYAPKGTMVILCRRFRSTVLCVDWIANGQALPGISYERGRPMPLFRGATSKVILAQNSTQELQRLYRAHHAEVQAANLGTTWPEFATRLAEIRKAKHCIAYAEVDPNRVGISAPILDSNRRILGSLSYVISMTEQGAATRLAAIVMDGVRDIHKAMFGAG